MTTTTLTEITLYCTNPSCKVESINYHSESIVKCDTCGDFESTKTRELLRCYECADYLIDKGIDFDSTDETYRLRSK